MSLQILVPLDGSRFSEQAVTSAYRIAQLSRATVHLVRVVRPAFQASTEVVSVGPPALHEIREEAREYLAKYAAQLPPGTAVRCAVLQGPDSVARILADYIARAHIRLVIMTTHARTGWGRLWVGSVADELLRMVKIPLLLLRPHRRDSGPAVECWHAHHVLVPLDGSERAEAALAAAVELGQLTGARFTLVQVVKPALLDVRPEGTASRLDEPALQQDLDSALAYLDRTASRLRAVGIGVETRAVTHPDIAQGIVLQASASNADTIALATHGRSGWKRLTLGSVAQEVLRRAHLSLLLLRTVETAPDAALLETPAAR